MQIEKINRGKGLASDRSQPNAKGRAKNTLKQRSRKESSERASSEYRESVNPEDMPGGRGRNRGRRTPAKESLIGEKMPPNAFNNLPQIDIYNPF
jgi:hypothetical protein